MSKFRLWITGDLGFEFWADIPEYEGLYQASTYGRARSVDRTVLDKNGKMRHYKEKLLKFYSDEDGYRQVILSKNNNQKRESIHQLVALTFIPNPNNYPCINHKSEIPSENFVWNLEWCDAKYNCNYGNRNNKIGKANSRRVLQYDLKNNFIKEWDSIIEAEQALKICHISMCCYGIRKRAGKYIWRFAQ